MFVIENGKYYELGRKALAYSIFQKSVVPIILFVLGALVSMAGVVTLVPGTPSPIAQALIAVGLVGVAIAVIVEIIVSVVAKLEYSVSRVMLDDTSLRIVHGIFNKSEIALPFRRINSVEIKQGMLHQIFKVGHVVITTITDLEQPGKSPSEVDDEVVPVMEYDLSKAVADALTSRAEVERMHVEGGGNITK